VLKEGKKANKHKRRKKNWGFIILMVEFYMYEHYA